MILIVLLSNAVGSGATWFFVHRAMAAQVAPKAEDKAKETVGMGQTPVTEAAKGDRPLDREKAFDALGVSMVEEYGEWKPDGAPMDSFRAMYRGQMRMVGGPELKDRIAYAFGAEFVEVRVNRWTHEIRVPRLLGAFAASSLPTQDRSSGTRLVPR